MDIVLGKVGAEIANQTVGSSGAGSSSFHDVLTSMDGQTDLQSLGIDQSDITGSATEFNAMSAENVTLDPSHMNAVDGGGSDKLVGMLSDVNKSQMQMDNLLNEVLYGGKQFTNQELLVVQAQIHSISELTELTVKVAEMSVNSLKSVLGTQV